MPSVNFSHLISKNQSLKKKHRKSKSSKSKKIKKQKGGVGVVSDIFSGDKVGGQAIHVATSDCGPGIANSQRGGKNKKSKSKSKSKSKH